MNLEEELFPWQSTYHPHERALPLTKEDLLSLPDAAELQRLLHETWQVGAHESKPPIDGVGAGAVLLLVALAWLVWWCFRRRKATRAAVI